MNKGITLRLTGPGVAETAKALGTRLIELGCGVEQLDAAVAEALGGARGAALVCKLLSRNGVIVIATVEGVDPAGECLDVELDANDTPDFAAEKILDALDEEGFVSLEESDYSEEEEEQIRRRLADLGYIE